jgi:hypothetical protein
MADNTTLPGTGDVVRDVDKAGKKAQVFILDRGGSGTEEIGALGDATNGIDVDVTRVTGTVTVDSELNAAAALADGASATVSTATVGSVGLVMNATTLDRQRAVVAALDSTGTGIATAGIVGQFDDTSTAAVTENQFAPARISSARALIVDPRGSASIASGQVTPTASAATLLAARATRIDVTFINGTNMTVYIGPATVTTGNGLALPPGAGITIRTGALLQNIVSTVTGLTGVVSYLESYNA